MSETAVKDPFDDIEEDEALFSSFEPEPTKTPEEIEKAVKAANSVGEKQGFQKRAKPKKRQMRRSQYYQTGRSEQIAFRGTEDDKDEVHALCEKHDWVKGQLLRYALDALNEKLADPKAEFWDSRNFEGVE